MRNFIFLGAFVTATVVAGEGRTTNLENCLAFFKSESVAATLLSIGYAWVEEAGNPDSANAADIADFDGLRDFLQAERSPNCSQYLVVVAENVSPEKP
jgi:hypothetical protein